VATNASSPSAYATVDDALALRDKRLWLQLCSDTSTEATVANLKDPTTDPGKRMAAVLRKASFEVESVATRGGRYAADDLAALEGNARAGLAGMVVDIAIVEAHKARQPLMAAPDVTKETAEKLKALGNGDAIFGTLEAEQAGAGMETVLQPDQQPGPRPAISDLSGRLFGSRARTYTADGSRGRGRCW
jgi:hypothetical protein